MKIWTKIRKDRRLKTEIVRYNKANPYDFVFSGTITLGGEWFSVIAGSDEGGWEHVSVCGVRRCPTWEEMCEVKDIFWNEDEECIEIHPKKAEYVNIMDFCLHIWRYKGGMILPPGR